ncbi:hypothetical protein [Nocardia yamanashiensis]|uniref:hypothetical protein n=1 Tax=Nocardia yamanashiensis TaxID=209247 RepID=UPI00082A3BD0|nr:hypothetical protein [Nocardia yamanashiensis]
MDTNTEAAQDFNAKTLLAAQQLDAQWLQSVLDEARSAICGSALVASAPIHDSILLTWRPSSTHW